MFLIQFAHVFWILSLETLRRVRIPDVLAMTKGSIKHAALSIFLAPGDWIVPGFVAIWPLVEKQQTMNFRTVEPIQQINLILQMENLRQIFTRRVALVLVNTIHLRLNGIMALKLSPNHLHIRIQRL